MSKIKTSVITGRIKQLKQQLPNDIEYLMKHRHSVDPARLMGITQSILGTLEKLGEYEMLINWSNHPDRKEQLDNDDSNASFRRTMGKI